MSQPVGRTSACVLRRSATKNDGTRFRYSALRGELADLEAVIDFVEIDRASRPWNGPTSFSCGDGCAASHSRRPLKVRCITASCLSVLKRERGDWRSVARVAVRAITPARMETSHGIPRTPHERGAGEAHAQAGGRGKFSGEPAFFDPTSSLRVGKTSLSRSAGISPGGAETFGGFKATRAPRRASLGRFAFRRMSATPSVDSSLSPRNRPYSGAFHANSLGFGCANGANPFVPLDSDPYVEFDPSVLHGGPPICWEQGASVTESSTCRK